MGIELGKAYVQVIPSTRGIKGQLTESLTGATTAAGKKSGISFAGKFGKTILKGMGAIGIATSIGSIMSKGWDRMLSIDTAKAKLKALGNDSETVKRIADNANAAVKGTAYGMDAAMTAAASATAAGIKPGKELTRYLGLMGDAASVSGVSMEEMGSIFNKVAANGKISTEEMNQLADRGIPIWQLLADETGMSMEELRKAVTNGQIDIEDFQNAIESGMGGAAKTMGSETIQGAISNIGASFSRMGANILGSADDTDSFAGRLLPLMNNVMDFMGLIESGASVLGEVIGAIIGPIMDGIGNALNTVGQNIGKVSPLKDIFIKIGNGIGQLISAIMPLLIPAIELGMQYVGHMVSKLKTLQPVISAVLGVLKTVINIAVPILTGVMKTVGAVVSFIKGELSFKGLVAKIGKIWSGVKEKMTAPMKKAKEQLSKIKDKIKNMFPFNLGKILKLKLPKISVSKGKAPWGIGGKGSKPEFNVVKWAAKGGIVDGATIIGAGEAGAEAIVPLDPFWKRLDENGKIDYAQLAAAIVSALSSVELTNNLNVDGRTVASVTAPYLKKELDKIQTRNNRKLGYI